MSGDTPRTREGVMNRLPKPTSNRDWFVWAVPSEEAVEIADAWEDDRDAALREMAQAAREYARWWDLDR